VDTTNNPRKENPMSTKSVPENRPAKGNQANEGKKPEEGKKPGHSDQIRRAKWLFGIILVFFLFLLFGWVAMHLHPEQWWPPKMQWVGPDDEAYKKPPWQWFDWLLSSLIGVLLYALVNVAYWYHEKRPRFIEFTPWYISTVLKGPIMAFIIMLFVTSVSLEVSGLTVDFKKLGPNVLLVAAFVLGFYSRVAREQLNLIVKALFAKAYSKAEELFNIVPRRAQVRFGQSVLFRTSPATEVTWLASAGKIENGTYTAPKMGEEDAKSGQVVQITAVPKDPNVPRATAQVTLVPFEIVGKAKIAYKAAESYQLAPEQAGGVTWSVSPEISGSSIDEQGVYKAPTQQAVKEAGVEKVTITATSKTAAEDFATLDVYFSSK
jgi:hypothetical protein